jgi:anti-sigma regulatory factor (Ser/Thr protein kinase)
VPERLCDEIVDEFAEGSLDDLVFLCLRREARDTRIFRKVFPAVPKALQQVRQELRGWLTEQGLDQRRIEDVVQACGEGCANIVRHAYGEQPGEATLELRLRSDGTLVTRIRDAGTWRPRAHTESSGHGMEIMRAVSEEVHVHRTPQGTTVVMVSKVGTPRRDAPAPAPSGAVSTAPRRRL